MPRRSGRDRGAGPAPLGPPAGRLMAAARSSSPSPSTTSLLPPPPPPSVRSRRSRRLDERLARTAVAWSIDPDMAAEDIADRLVTLAEGNRTALLRALTRIEAPRHTSVPRRAVGTVTTARGRASAALRLALARGRWAW